MSASAEQTNRNTGPEYYVLHTDRDQPVDPEDRLAFEQLGAQLVFVHTKEEFLRLADRALAILNTNFKITAELIDALENCRVIARYGSGYDNIDIAAATKKKIPVAYVPVFCVEEVANRAFTLLLACAAQLLRLDRMAREGVWGVVNLPFSAQIEGRTLGIVGFGKIGRAMAARAKPFGLSVIAYDPLVNPEVMAAEGVSFRSLDDLLSESDFVSIHSPLNTATRHLIDAARLALMKTSAYLINTSRGGLIDEGALIDCLQAGRIAGAGLDVFEQEPPGRSNPLFSMDNVIVTPHCAAHTELANRKVRQNTIEAVLRALRGERPWNVVNPEVWQKPAGVSS